ncbi:MAG: c-type cytochrome [Thiogranum sp.]|nr:c-type cytochrome [Thiogranum sp.]
MSNSTQTRTTAVLLAASLLMLGGCEKAEETAQSTAPEVAPTPLAPPQQQRPATEPATSAAQDESAMAQAPTTAQAAEGAATQGAATGSGDVETAMRNAGCFACHEVEQKKLGPAYAWVAHRYQDDANALETLMNSIKNGGSGKWTALTGGIPMPPNMQLSDEQTRAMAQWILDREPQEPPAR